MTESRRPLVAGLFTKPGDQIVAKDNETPQVISADGASDGDVWTYNATTKLPHWGAGAASGVVGVTAGDSTVTVGGSAAHPTVKVTPSTFDTAGAAAAAATASLPRPTGTATAGQVPIATGTGSASTWGNVGGGSSSCFMGSIPGTFSITAGADAVLDLSGFVVNTPSGQTDIVNTAGVISLTPGTYVVSASVGVAFESNTTSVTSQISFEMRPANINSLQKFARNGVIIPAAVMIAGRLDLPLSATFIVDPSDTSPNIQFFVVNEDGNGNLLDVIRNPTVVMITKTS